MQDLDRPPSSEELATLRAAWTDLTSLAAQLETGSVNDRIEIYAGEYEDHLAQLKAARVADAVVANVRTWANEPAERTLQRFVEQAASPWRQRLATWSTRCIEMRVSPAGLRLALAALGAGLVGLLPRAAQYFRPRRGDQGASPSDEQAAACQRRDLAHGFEGGRRTARGG